MLAAGPSQQRNLRPYGLMSLKDMHSLHAHVIPHVYRSLERLKAIVETHKSLGRWEADRQMKLSKETLETPLSLVTSVSMLCQTLKCTNTGKAAKRLTTALETSDQFTLGELADGYQDIQSRFDDELEDQFIFIISPERAAFWNKSDLVSQHVKDWSAEVAQELLLAANAYCCDLQTASVFHSMRAAERGIRQAAEELEIDVTSDENWKNVIDQIQKKARALDERPKDLSKSATCQHYSEIALDAGLIKDAWRNHVAHAKIDYLESQALKVLNATCGFCEKLASPSVERKRF